MQIKVICLYIGLCIWVLSQLLFPFFSMLMAQVPRLRKNKCLVDRPPHFDFACIITAYRNGAIAVPLVESLLAQTYPDFTIYLVADECDMRDLQWVDRRVVVLKPPAPLRLKVRSIIWATEHFRRAHEYIVIFDADNLAHPQFLEQIGRYITQGYRVVQGQRRAKNLDTTYAALDSLGEHYKNYIERQVPFALGSSAVISGSGMATETALYKAYLESPEIQEGQHRHKRMLQEDKILQNFLLRENVRIAYAREAVVYDEKVSSGAAVETQRSRWLYSYFQNIPNAAGLLLRGVLFFRFNQLLFGWITLALPMFIQLTLAVFLALLGIFLAPAWTAALLTGCCVFALGVLWALQLDGAPPPVWKAVWRAPQFMFRQARSLMKMRNPDKHFEHTEHHKAVRVEDIMDQQ